MEKDSIGKFLETQDSREGGRALGWGIESLRLKAEDMTGGKHVKFIPQWTPSHPTRGNGTQDTRREHGDLLRIE
jgi:hypothetical protein